MGFLRKVMLFKLLAVIAVVFGALGVWYSTSALEVLLHGYVLLFNGGVLVFLYFLGSSNELLVALGELKK